MFPPTLKPVPWLLDALFKPERARHYPMLLVDNGEVLDAIEMPHEKRRGRYAFADFEPLFPKLETLVRAYGAKKQEDLSLVESQILSLYHNLVTLHGLFHYLDFARNNFPLHTTPALQKVFTAEDEGITSFLVKASAWQPLLSDAKASNDAPTQEALRVMLDAVEDMRMSHSLLLFPQTDPTLKEWISPSVMKFQLVGEKDPDHPERGSFHLPDPATLSALSKQLGFLSLLERLARNAGDQVAFKATLEKLHDQIVGLAKDRGEYSKVPLEIAFYKGDFFYRALAFYVFGFVLVALSWLWPSKLLKKGNLALLGIATAFLIAGIVIRCVIVSRPPVKTLYETIPFITSMAILAACVIEWINRQGIALSLATVLGVLGTFLTNKYEFKEALANGDTLANLQAVLDTNFWLATHVTCVTTGYSAGLLATALAHIWLVGKLLGYRKGDDKFYKGVARMTYGVVCFGLLFSVVGTILGGIWANYSWGRFWGWDPKENGALLICIWELIILHARMGGYIRDFGLSVLAVLGGTVVAFSWWGVNLLGVGLHAYGFTSGVAEILIGYCVLEAALAGVAIGWRMGQGDGKALPEAG
jgi:ABC-type transport system involved in cytochrome c biogenesis permease subunit